MAPQELEVLSLYHIYSLKTKSSQCHSNWVEPSMSIEVVHGISFKNGYERMLAACRRIFST